MAGMSSEAFEKTYALIGTVYRKLQKRESFQKNKR